MISNLAYIHPDAKLGANVTVEPFAYIAGDTVIGDDCWIGGGAILCPGVRIGPRSVVGAGSVVVRDVEPDVVVAGNPARVVRRLK